MRNMLSQSTRALLGAMVVATASHGEVMDVDGRSALVMQSDVVQLVVDLAGGSIKDFHRLDHGLNPLQWDSVAFDSTLAETPKKPRSMGHFLCLDRWGPASAAEMENGMGWHGEASRVVWEVVQDVVEQDGLLEAVLTADLPLAGLSVRRTIRMSQAAAVFEVTEAVTNNRPLGRIYNMVQHPTIGPPFLDKTTVVDANAGKGFMQGGTLPNPEEPSVMWPQALKRDGTAVNLRQFSDNSDPGVVSFVIDAEWGWTTAANAGKGLLIGYLWKTDDYAWYDDWRNVRDDKPFARGLEFGTSGLHQPFPILVQKGKIFDRQIFVHIDAGETVTRSYLNFLAPVGADFTGIEGVSYDGANLKLKPLAGETIVVDASALAR
ncbi:MAG: hypothetical protein VYD18_04135 [Candidatus Latescibacterota bacterium]|nr:hypothetical protein [Candidatus Latescibacterota bacterium]